MPHPAFVDDSYLDAKLKPIRLGYKPLLTGRKFGARHGFIGGMLRYSLVDSLFLGHSQIADHDPARM